MGMSGGDKNHKRKGEDVIFRETHRPKIQKTSSAPQKFNSSRPPAVRASALSDKQKAIQKQRARLPIYVYTSKIRYALQAEKNKKTPVLLLVGETGSGKSTQVPQYLLQEGWCQRGIAITQPRRVAATNLARRVAEEASSELGDVVGYSVRFDRKCGPNTKLKYLTEGTLLQELLRDPLLLAYDCVILDEVHERSIDCDLLLGFLRRLVSNPKARCREGVEPLRVVVMSATANTEELFDFFQEGFGSQKAPQKSVRTVSRDSQPLQHTANTYEPTSRVNAGNLPANDESKLIIKQGKNMKSSEALSKLLKTKLDGSKNSAPPVINGSNELPSSFQSSDAAGKSHSEEDEEEVEVISDDVASLHVQGRQYPVSLHYLERPTDDYVDAAFAKVLEIHKREALPGDILVFLTGQDTVESLAAQLRDKAGSLPPELPQLLPLPLFAALPRQQQQAIFKQTPPNTRKIVIATNIAETSLTISGVKYVVDAGRVKSKDFRSTLLMDTLLERPISKASATQRMGRAGREAPGKCYRLYTESQYNALPETTTPELLRADLLPVALGLRARGIENFTKFPLLTRPDELKLKEGFVRLLGLGAFDDEGNLTQTGRLMARLPVHPSYAKVIIASAIHEKSTTGHKNNYAPSRDAAESLTLLAIDTVAALQTDEPLTLALPSTMTNQDDSDDDRARENALSNKTALQATLHRREGDHLTAHAILTGYAAASDKQSWCSARHLSARALRNTLEVRTQLRATAIALKLLAKETVSDAVALQENGEALQPSEEQATQLVRCLLAGFDGNVALLHSDGGYKMAIGENRVDIHPSSALFGRKVEAIVFSEAVFTTRAFARGVSAVQLDWIQEAVGEMKAD